MTRWRRSGAALAGVAAWAVAAPVAVAAWSAPQDLVPVRTPTDGHRALAVDARGTALALLDHGDPLRYAEQAADGAWTRPRSLGPAFGAQLVTTPQGALVVWTDGAAGAAAVRAASRGLEGVWSAPAEIGRAPSRYAGVPYLSADAAGDAVAGVVDRVDAPYPSTVLARSAGGPWSPLDLGPVAPWARIVVDDAGAMTAVWRADAPDETAGRGRLRLALRPPGGAFAEAPSPTGEEAVALVALEGSARGDALLVASPDGLGRRVWLRPAGGAFGPPQTIRGEFWGAGVAAMGDDGTAAVAWRAPARGAPVRGDIRVMVRPPSGGFGAPVVIDAPSPHGAVTGPLVAVGDDGAVVVAWSALRASGRGRAGTVWAAVRPPGGAFGRAAVLNDRGLPAWLQRVAAGPRAAAVVTWTQSTGRGFALQAARHEPRPLIARLTAAARAGRARVRIVLGEPASVTVRLTRLGPAARGVARRSRSLPAGASTLALAGRALTRGHHRVEVRARSARRAAAASAHLRVPASSGGPRADR
ncbi:hypothetical protein [Miltoncostaea marina]|uniref:hypothetical protein n=1 Tax=Miltoncostaea marina TaxID=2843215 RepID=UPI001C3D8D2E|nr:hypothetical protein [Miltoncostaea marina]